MIWKWERTREHEGMMVPSKLLGFSYYELDRDVRVFYIIPFNIIIALWRRFYVWIRFECCRKINQRELAIHMAGFGEGYREGRKSGESWGIREGRRLENEEILERFDEGLEKRWGKYCEEQKDEPT